MLALDGGGIRGVMSLEVLAGIQAMLQQKLGRGDDFVLADYFDYVSGTSTGAIIATFISLGWRVEKILQFYRDAGPAMFAKAGFLKRFTSSRTRPSPTCCGSSSEPTPRSAAMRCAPC